MEQIIKETRHILLLALVDFYCGSKSDVWRAKGGVLQWLQKL